MDGYGFWLEQFRERLRELGGDLQPPCSNEAIALLRRRVQAELELALPDGYCDFLKQTDGLYYNISLFSSERMAVVGPQGSEGAETDDIVEQNLDFREWFPDYGHVLVLGQSSMDHYLFDLDTGEYLVKAGGSSDIFVRSLSFEPVFEYAARTGLGLRKPPQS